MSLKTNIINTDTGHEAQVDYTTGEKHALVVATRPLKVFNNATKFFTNDIYGVDINQDGSASGTPEKVHDGAETAFWTATDIEPDNNNKTTFNSAEQDHTSPPGQSVKVDNSPVLSTFQFAKGSNLDMNGYVSLTIWVYVDKDWKAGDDISIYGWDTGTTSQVGTAVSLQDYFNWQSFDN